MATVEIRARGVTEMVSAIDDASARLDQVVAQACAEAAEAMVARARPFTPPRGGYGALKGGLEPVGGVIVRNGDLRPERSLFPLPGAQDGPIEDVLGRALEELEP